MGQVRDMRNRQDIRNRQDMKDHGEGRAGLKETVSTVSNGRGVPEMTAHQEMTTHQEMTAHQEAPFTKLVEEFQEGTAECFGAWILRRTGLDRPSKKERAIFLVQGDIRSKKKSGRKATLVQYGGL